jgi:histidinol dehydrogenase
MVCNDVAADIFAQSEHHQGVSFLITTSKRLANAIRKTPARGYVIKVKNLSQGIQDVNEIAPEHLQIMVKRPERIVKHIRNAGAIFLGQYTPTAVGDYIAGPSHVLPTSRSARFSSGLGVTDFLKRTSIIGCDAASLRRIGAAAVTLAQAEGLDAHALSVALRLNAGKAR